MFHASCCAPWSCVEWFAPCLQFAQGSGSPKEETHYTNDGFQNEGDPCSAGSRPLSDSRSVESKPAEEPDLRFPAEREPRDKDTPPSKDAALPPPPPPPPGPYPDASPVTGSPAASDRSVRPILAKERKSEEGSKSVWFKEDHDPSAKEEILITPDGEDEDEGDDISPLPSPLPSPKVFFAETKTGDNAAVRFQDPGKNSDPESQTVVKDGKREYL